MSDDIPTAAQLRDNLRQRIGTLERERDAIRGLLLEVLASAVSYSAKHYEERQLAKSLIEEIRKAVTRE